MSEGRSRQLLLDRRPNFVVLILVSVFASAAQVPLGLWARHLGIGAGVVPVIDAPGRSFWFVGIVVALAFATLFQLLSQRNAAQAPVAIDHEKHSPASANLPTAWILPLISSLTATMLLAIYHSRASLICVALVLFFVLGTGSISRSRLLDSDIIVRERAHGFQTIILHIVAFFALSMVYINKLPSRYVGPAAFLVVALLLLQLTEGEECNVSRRVIYGLAGGILLGEITWVLSYWDATGWTGGATLLVFFYLSAGLIVAQVRQGVESRDVLEYGGVSLFAFAIVMYSLFR